jgi:hypothetical protein
MITTPQGALEKIRRQIRIAERYFENNPDWKAPEEVLKALRIREAVLANLIQVENFKAALLEGIDEAKAV